MHALASVISGWVSRRIRADANASLNSLFLSHCSPQWWARGGTWLSTYEDREGHFRANERVRWRWEGCPQGNTLIQCLGAVEKSYSLLTPNICLNMVRDFPRQEDTALPKWRKGQRIKESYFRLYKMLSTWVFLSAYIFHIGMHIFWEKAFFFVVVVNTPPLP